MQIFLLIDIILSRTSTELFSIIRDPFQLSRIMKKNDPESEFFFVRMTFFDLVTPNQNSHTRSSYTQSKFPLAIFRSHLYFLHLCPSFCPKPTRNTLPMPFFALKFAQKWRSGRFWAKQSPEIFKLVHKNEQKGHFGLMSLF